MSSAPSTSSYLATLQNRRTNYALTSSSPIPASTIKDLTATILKTVPSAFNSQTTRIVLVLGPAAHQKLWDSIIAIYKAMLPADKFEHFKGRAEGFRGAYGTALFYEDNETVREFQEKFKPYEDKFPGWSEQTNGMHQYALWTALASEGLGVNLQHYNPLIDKKLETELDVPETWSLKAQMVFGKPVQGPGEKTSEPVEKRLKVIGE